MIDSSLFSASSRTTASLSTVDPAERREGLSYRLQALVLLALASVLVLLMRRAGLSIDPSSRTILPYYAAGMIALALRLGSRLVERRPARAVGDMAEYFALFTLIALMGAIASYPVSALTHGYADVALQAVDERLHFDWLAWYRAVASHRWLQLTGIGAYESIYLSPALLLGWFALDGDRRSAHRFLAAFVLSAVVTLALFSLMPAVGPFAHLWHGPIPYMPTSELWQPDLIPQLRAHQVRVVDIGQLRGLVSAPSFHTAAATLYIATAWRVRALRWPLLTVNVAMLLSTPVEGTHYLADMLLGAMVGMVAMTVAGIGVPRRGSGCRGGGEVFEGRGALPVSPTAFPDAASCRVIGCTVDPGPSPG